MAKNNNTTAKKKVAGKSLAANKSKAAKSTSLKAVDSRPSKTSNKTLGTKNTKAAKAVSRKNPPLKKSVEKAEKKTAKSSKSASAGSENLGKAKKKGAKDLKPKEINQSNTTSSKIRAAAPRLGSPKLREESKEEAPPSPPMILAPTDKMLKPFRDAAKRNSKAQIEKGKAKRSTSFLAKAPKTGKKCFLDLRVHTPMSEGYFSTGGVDPAAAMVRLAKAKGLDILGITDYHSADFVDEVKKHAKETQVMILPGLDLQCVIASCNEVTMVALFPEEFGSRELNDVLKELEIPNHAKGCRTYSIPKDVKEVIDIVEKSGGILIPSRLDKTPSRQVALNELVEAHGFHAFDMVHPENPDYFKSKWPSGEFTFLSFSNANALGQIGTRAMTLKLSQKGFSGLKTLFARRTGKEA